MGCREFFQANAENKERCKTLQAISPSEQLAWEGETASEHSPCVVEDDEVLCRHVENPTHFDASSRTIKPTFFDDASNKGASVNRLSHTTIAAVQQRAQAKVAATNENPPLTGVRRLIGYTTITASEVRAVFTSPSSLRALGVYDTAKPDDPSHADICQLVSGKQQGKSVRAQLYQIAKNRLMRFSSSQEKDR